MQQHNRYQIICGHENNSLLKNIFALRKKVWPDFLRLSNKLIREIYTRYPQYQMSILDTQTKNIIAIANALPIEFQQSLAMLPDTGLSWVMQAAHQQYKKASPNMLCAISVSIHPAYRNQGISRILIQQLKQLANKEKFLNLILPLRPNLKCHFPLIPMQQYVNWQNADGLPFDSWLRIHVTAGATIVKICHQSICVSASVDKWKRWTGLSFPEAGAYIIKDALLPVTMDANKNINYIEPNIWIAYSLRKERW